MSWHRAAAVLASVFVPMLATAAYAKPHHHQSGVAHLIHHRGAAHEHRVAHGPRSHHARFDRSARTRHGRWAGRSVRRLPAAESTGSFDGGFSSSSIVSLARQFNGTNPTGRSRQWCAEFANMVLQRSGHHGSGSALARSFASYGRPAPGPAPGVIAVFPHHVGFVVGSEGPGRIRVVSGNHGRRVGEGVYPTARVIAYRYPG